MRILMGILMGILIGILMMDSMGWPYDSSDCLLFLYILYSHITKSQIIYIVTFIGLDLHFLMCLRMPFSPFVVVNWHQGHSSSFTFSASGSLMIGKSEGVGGCGIKNIRIFSGKG